VQPFGIVCIAGLLLPDLPAHVLAHAEEATASAQAQIVSRPCNTAVAPLSPVAQASPQSVSAAPSAPTYSAAFTPGQALPLVLETIRAAKSSLLVAAYSLTSKPVAVALRDAHRRGVQVFVVIDAGEAAKSYSAGRFLANERVPVRTNARYTLQHNKFIVADGTVVQTGSFNYTAAAAERNAENVLVVGNAPALGAQYTREWRRLWDEGVDLPPTY
jgi:phosphatidylserine/phosphatidylglycerophosphate/cardiolipin synthase-like enzyme